ncbi:hypothetical protein AAHA92_23199 [Salvia divinorum]|uniref:TmcB/TmcC TPR repeats domain-containing protein n=1 Tax=Salvia divinorum TaxID=28513 RepID=A0ABD1GUY8_SALDI
MMLRSSSTPVLGSLLQSFSDCSNNNSNGQHQSELHKQAKIPYHCSSNGGGSQDFKKSLIHKSPSLSEIKVGGGGGFRRAQSDGNLERLGGDASSYSFDEFNLPKRSTRRSSLEAIPSFSANNLWTSFEDDEDDYEGIEEGDDGGIGGGLDYNPLRAEHVVFEKMARNAIAYGSEGLGSQSEGKMYLASGIGVSGVDFAGRGGGGGGRGSYKPVDFDKEGGGGVSVEEHYKRMLELNPGDPLFLRNYAEFLYKIKGDVGAAEEYYARAILADQEDGETLAQYAKIIWEVHHDRDRAANYFQRALEASSQNSHIHAAYANFLWDAEDEDEDEENMAGSQSFLHQGVMASATA